MKSDEFATSGFSWILSLHPWIILLRPSFGFSSQFYPKSEGAGRDQTSIGMGPSIEWETMGWHRDWWNFRSPREKQQALRRPLPCWCDSTMAQGTYIYIIINTYIPKFLNNLTISNWWLQLKEFAQKMYILGWAQVVSKEPQTAVSKFLEKELGLESGLLRLPKVPQGWNGPKFKQLRFLLIINSYVNDCESIMIAVCVYICIYI